MVDSERKADQASNGAGLQGDPLLELTRLFGARSRQVAESTQAPLPMSNEIKDTERETSTSWSPGMSTQSAGISMAGSLMMAGYGTTNTPPHSHDPVEYPEPREETSAAPAQDPSTFMEEVQASHNQENGQENGQGNWQEPSWGEMPESMQVLANEYDDAQILQALEGDLANEVSAATAEIIATETDFSSLSSQDEELPPSLTASDFSEGYFGYGQSVQINVTAPTSQIVSNIKPQKSTSEQIQPQDQGVSPSIAHPLSQPLSQPMAAPLTVPTFSQDESEPPEFLPNFSHTNETIPDFAETLHDFDLTIRRERHRPLKRHSITPPIEQTEAFDLPSMDHDTPPFDSSINDFADDFTVGLQTERFVGEKPFFANEPSDDGQNFFSQDHATPSSPIWAPNEDAILVANEKNKDAMSSSGLYDWNEVARSSPQMKQPVKKRNKIYMLFAVVMLVTIAGGGYWFYDIYTTNMMQAVLIRSDTEAIKVKPEAPEENQANLQDTGVYNQDATSASPGSQTTLLDNRETPLDIDVLNIPSAERDDMTISSNSPPPVDMSALDPVDASILAAIGRTLPVHIVPTVTISRDSNGNVSDIAHSQDGDEILVPASDYQTSILQQLTQSTSQEPRDDSNSLGHNIEEIAALEGQPDQQNNQIQAGSTNEMDEIVSPPLMADIPPTQEIMPTSLQDASSSSVVDENEVSSLSLANIPAIIPNKPTMSQPQMNIAPPQQGQQQDSIEQSNGLSESIVDERFYVQVSSQASQQAAITSAAEMEQRFASLVGGNQIVIVPADIPGRGIYYRVRILVPEHADAVRLCEDYQAAGGSCFVGR